MWRSSLFLLLIVVGLAVGCGPVMEPSLSPTGESDSSTSPLPTPLNRPESPVPTPAGEGHPAEVQPPVDDGATVPAAPAARARVDLARRLQIDSTQIVVVSIATREVDEAMDSCPGRGSESERFWNEQEEARWVTLGVGGKRYHYVVLRDLTIYCGM